MKESWPHNIHPNSIIDLRPQKVARFSSAWQDLMAVRFIFFLGRLGLRAFYVLVDIVYRIFRFVGLFFLDIYFGVKSVFVSAKYAGAEGSLKMKTAFNVIGAALLLIPRALFNFIKRIYLFFYNTFFRIGRGVKREVSSVVVKPLRKHHSPVFHLANFILLLALVAAPVLLYGAWRTLQPLRQSVTNSATAAFNGLFSAKGLIETRNFSGAETAFQEAGVNFIKAQDDLSAINQGLLDLAGVLPDKNFKLASESGHILAAGKLSARLGAELAMLVEPSVKMTLVSFLDRFAKTAMPASDEAKQLMSELNKINENNLPQQYREQFLKLRGQAEFLAPSLNEAGGLAEQASTFLGKQMDKRYLLVFQNNFEKRASGGFIGSFATVDLSRGEIKNLVVPKGGSYDTEAGLTTLVASPEPLRLLNPLWHFWDANWWPDWPTSAKKLEWFYEKSNGPTVDGVISLTPTVMEKLLAVHGPVDMTEKYGVIITADNFWTVTQTFSEQKPSATKEPKRIIGDLMAKLMQDVPKDLDLQKSLALVGVLEQSLNEKQILMYFNDPSLEASVQSFGWDGSVKQTEGDYLMVVSSNIGGQKSDRAIIETINHQAEILPDGQIIVTLSISRQHTAQKNEQFTGVRNVDWLRVYVPEGSTLISASGFRQPEAVFFKQADPKWQLDPDLANERAALTDSGSGTKIYSEDNKTVFANWSMVDPGETALINLQYRLPFNFKKRVNSGWFGKIKDFIETDPTYRYSLLAQKQPGATNSSLVSNFSIAGGWQPIWTYPTTLVTTKNGWNFNQPLQTDSYTTVLFHKK